MICRLPGWAVICKPWFVWMNCNLLGWAVVCLGKLRIFSGQLRSLPWISFYIYMLTDWSVAWFICLVCVNCGLFGLTMVCLGELWFAWGQLICLGELWFIKVRCGFMVLWNCVLLKCIRVDLGEQWLGLVSCRFFRWAVLYLFLGQEAAIVCSRWAGLVGWKSTCAALSL